MEWARSEKRTFLRQRIEARLANLYLETKDFPAALSLISRLLTEVSCIPLAKCKPCPFAQTRRVVSQPSAYVYIWPLHGGKHKSCDFTSTDLLESIQPSHDTPQAIVEDVSACCGQECLLKRVWKLCLHLHVYLTSYRSCVYHKVNVSTLRHQLNGSTRSRFQSLETNCCCWLLGSGEAAR